MLEDFNCPGVYGLSVDGEILYVGSSKNVKKRLSAHYSLLKNGGHKKELQKAYDDGKDITPVLLDRLNEKNVFIDLLSCEQKWIDELSPVCNARDPVVQHPIKTISWLNYESRQRRFGTINNKSEYYRKRDETKESETYAMILDEIDRYYSFFESDNLFPFKRTDGTNYLVVRTDRNIAAAVKQAALNARESLPQFILEAIQQRMESESATNRGV